MNRITIGEKHYPVKLSQKALKRFEEATELSYAGLITTLTEAGNDVEKVLAFVEAYGFQLLSEALNGGEVASRLYGEEVEKFPFTVDEMEDLFSIGELTSLVMEVLKDLGMQPSEIEAKKKPIEERLRGK